MTKPLLEYSASADFNPACRECPARCCTTATWGYAPSPLSPQEFKRLQVRTGDKRFLDRFDHFPVIRTETDGRCTFLDPKTHECTVYSDRPFDCRAFPFDFFSVNDEEAYWVLWDCPYSQALREGEIEQHLQQLEEKYGAEMKAIWHYGNEDYAEAGGAGGDESPLEGQKSHKAFRVLRKVKLRPEE